MVSCEDCRSAYLNPRPTKATVGLAYQAYHTHAPVARVATPRSGLARLRESLLNGYLNHRFGYQRRPASKLGAALVAALPSARGTARHLIRDLHHSSSGVHRLLDVGCGNGEFLARMADSGWEREGLEPDPAAVAHAQEAGLTVHQGELGSDSLRPGLYDAITLGHVVEHLHEPVADLRACYSLLKPGGMIWIATPNIGATGHDVYGRDWFALEPPRHLVMFTRDSLALALRRAGFEIVPHPPVMPCARQWMFQASAALAQGLSPIDNPPPLTKAGGFHARRADLRALARPETAEELVMIGRKPFAG